MFFNRFWHYVCFRTPICAFLFLVLCLPLCCCFVAFLFFVLLLFIFFAILFSLFLLFWAHLDSQSFRCMLCALLSSAPFIGNLQIDVVSAGIQYHLTKSLQNKLKDDFAMVVKQLCF